MVGCIPTEMRVRDSGVMAAWVSYDEYGYSHDDIYTYRSDPYRVELDDPSQKRFSSVVVEPL